MPAQSMRAYNGSLSSPFPTLYAGGVLMTTSALLRRGDHLYTAIITATFLAAECELQKECSAIGSSPRDTGHFR